MKTPEELRASLATLRRKHHLSGPAALLLADIIEAIGELQQAGMSAIRADLFPEPRTIILGPKSERP